MYFGWTQPKPAKCSHLLSSGLLHRDGNRNGRFDDDIYGGSRDVLLNYLARLLSLKTLNFNTSEPSDLG